MKAFDSFLWPVSQFRPFPCWWSTLRVLRRGEGLLRHAGNSRHCKVNFAVRSAKPFCSHFRIVCVLHDQGKTSWREPVHCCDQTESRSRVSPWVDIITMINVIGIDESKCMIFDSDGTRYVRHREEKRFDPNYQLPTANHEQFWKSYRTTSRC